MSFSARRRFHPGRDRGARRFAAAARDACALVAFASAAIVGLFADKALAAEELRSPDGRIAVYVDVTADGAPTYEIKFDDATIVDASRLGFRLKGEPALDAGFRLAGAERAERDEAWEQPWGERRAMRDRHNELLATFRGTGADDRREFSVRFRAFDDGVSFRYEVPTYKGRKRKPFEIMSELTEFAIGETPTAWWTPSGEFNRYEYIYRTTPARDVSRAHTPVTFRTEDGVHISVHEAALIDYAGMSLDQRRPGVFKAHLYPRADGVLVRKKGRSRRHGGRSRFRRTPSAY